MLFSLFATFLHDVQASVNKTSKCGNQRKEIELRRKHDGLVSMKLIDINKKGHAVVSFHGNEDLHGLWLQSYIEPTRVSAGHLFVYRLRYYYRRLLTSARIPLPVIILIVKHFTRHSAILGEQSIYPD